MQSEWAVAIRELVRDGQLASALAQTEDRVRASPADAPLRICLFQLLVVRGDWTRALTQLQALGHLDAASLPMVQNCRAAIHCDGIRSKVFDGTATPRVLGEPERWVALLLAALHSAHTGTDDRAAELRAEAFDLAPAIAGRIDGSPFQWIADADSRLGPVLEAVIDGTYCWIPFACIREIHIEAPTDLRDLVWSSVRFVWSNGSDRMSLVPTRYPGSEASAESALQLARRTEWRLLGGDAYAGIGQRMLATDAGDYPLLDTRVIALDTALKNGKSRIANDRTGRAGHDHDA